ncbi:cupredoxin domain-containing protein [Xylocopilactobacillus apicola]|uniref:Copper-binding protein n=1 Tax=Xylocopilactobacillus apicola TaxID=2932184 RepID=A0AAU9DVR8_9LACO|nr:cupredoxin domain-containing protein [Xylocopilactobacillus apicola]BDR57978.1 copper-binding protein [Xylocopilactobacillus apicola]
MQKAKILINKGYKPDTIEFHRSDPAEITFVQEDSSVCLRQVQSKDLNFQIDLPVGSEKTININTDQTGEFNFSCGMGMFHGKVIVK